MQHVIFLGSEAFIGIPQTVAIERTYLGGRPPVIGRLRKRGWQKIDLISLLLNKFS